MQRAQIYQTCDFVLVRGCGTYWQPCRVEAARRCRRRESVYSARHLILRPKPARAPSRGAHKQAQTRVHFSRAAVALGAAEMQRYRNAVVKSGQKLTRCRTAPFRGRVAKRSVAIFFETRAPVPDSNCPMNCPLQLAPGRRHHTPSARGIKWGRGTSC